MNDLLKSLGNATETEREKIIRDAGYEFTYDELKQALNEYNDHLIDDLAGGACEYIVTHGGISGGSRDKSPCISHSCPPTFYGS